MLKQYLRWLPAQLGLFNYGAFLLQIDKILPDDLFIASYPKSGNTWLRFILANLKSNGEEVNFKNIDNYVSDVYSAKQIINSQKNNRIIKTHQTLFEFYPKTLYIYRDYRDVLVSFYHYEMKLKHFDGTFEEFISSKNVVIPFGSWKDHVQAAFEFKKLHHDRIHILSYEELLNSPIASIKSIAQFCNIQPKLSFEEINSRCEFSKLKENEANHKSDFMEYSNQHFFREGKKGDWRNYFNEKMMHEFKNDTALAALMEKLGYTI